MSCHNHCIIFHKIPYLPDHFPSSTQVTDTRAAGSGLDSVPVACFVLLVTNTRAAGSGLDSVPVACFVLLVTNTRAAGSGLDSVPVARFLL